MTALMISTIKVKDREKLGEYLHRVQPIAARHGAQMVFNGPLQGAICGATDHQLAVVVKFPSTEAINAMFADEEYQPLIPLREEASDMTVLKYRSDG